MTEPTRLPGVKGSWILCFECPPTKADCDSDGEVRVYNPSAGPGCKWNPPYLVQQHDHWCPADHADPRPFTLPSAAPPQPAAGARKFDTLSGNTDGSILWAVADDGTAWERARTRLGYWRQLPSLPDREVG